MKNGIMVSVAIVLLVGSSAIGQIHQETTWSLFADNTLNWSAGGPGSITVPQGAFVFGYQHAGINPDDANEPTVTGDQGVVGGALQVGTLVSDGAPLSLEQHDSVSAVGGLLNPIGQSQTVSDLSGPIEQYQGAELSGTQKAEKGEGSLGTINGFGLVGFGMGEVGVNTCGQGTQLSILGGGQSVMLTGGAQGSGEVDSEIYAGVVQVQEIND